MASANPLHIRVFLSSPGDVNVERRFVHEVVEALAKDPAYRDKVTFDIVAYDDPDAPSPMEAGETPQLSVNRYKGRPADCDLTVVILWSRIGTQLPEGVVRADGSRFESGTVWEYEDALAAKKTVWVYRRDEEPKIGARDPQFQAKQRQLQAVDDFFASFKNPDGSAARGSNRYIAPQDFQNLFEKQLKGYLTSRLDAIRAIDKRPPFLVPSHERGHKIIGRLPLITELRERLLRGEDNSLVYLPGVGKTALALEVVRDRDFVSANFDGVLWADLGRQPLVLEQLRRWADALHVPDESKVGLASVDDWKSLIKKEIGERRLLVVLDDVYEEKLASEFINLGPNCLYIITTRNRNVAAEFAWQATEVAPLDEESGIALLKDIAPEAVNLEPAAAQELFQAVEGLPLALVLIGKYLKRESVGGDPDDIRVAFRKMQQAGECLQLKQRNQEAGTERSLSDIIDVSYAALESDTARQVFRSLSIFRPKPHTFSKELAAQVCGTDPTQIRALRGMGLIEHREGGNYTMHRVIAEYARAKLAAQDSLELHHKALHYYAEKLQSTIDDDPGAYMGWYRYEQLDWQATKDAWLYHLAHSGDSLIAVQAFLRVYFDAFWWWGYYQSFPFCDLLIRAWTQRGIDERARQVLEQLTAFQQAYPAGYEKRGNGDWEEVERALKAIREGVNVAHEAPDIESEDARRVRAFTDFFLGEAYGYGRGRREESMDLYRDAHALFLTVDGEWEAAWIWFYVGQYLLEEGDFTAVQDYAHRSLAELGKETVLEESDPELLANNYRLLGDASLAAGDLDAAAASYDKAALYAYAFQAIPQPADTYTMAFYGEITGRIAGKVLELCAERGGEAIKNKLEQGKRLANAIHDFWAPYWTRYGAAKEADLDIILGEGNRQALLAYLFPPGIEGDVTTGAAAYAQRVLVVVEALRKNPQASAAARSP